jgi:uncharacterized membrane protein
MIMNGALSQSLRDYLPNLFVAVLILTFGYFAAKIVSRIVTNLLQATGVNRFTVRKGETAEAGRLQLATLIGYVVFVLILMPIVIAALQALRQGFIDQNVRSLSEGSGGIHG